MNAQRRAGARRIGEPTAPTRERRRGGLEPGAAGPETKADGTESKASNGHDLDRGTRAAFQEFIERLRPYVVGQLHRGAACPVKAVAGRCREILDLEPALWTFACVVRVEPTNNAAELRVRHGVLWRKVSFGTNSPSGSRFVERILTVVTTLRMQERNVLDYVTDACDAVLQGRDAPSLLPGWRPPRSTATRRRSLGGKRLHPPKNARRDATPGGPASIEKR
ncbi:hypothetical protein [Sorangium sp. So ce1389]|uniref:hypothetical protein n=1 Tax=Sorangium sp. So ce1389 TaxID=3133336 RepID=UPI003F5DE791